MRHGNTTFEKKEEKNCDFFIKIFFKEFIKQTRRLFMFLLLVVVRNDRIMYQFVKTTTKKRKKKNNDVKATITNLWSFKIASDLVSSYFFYLRY